MTRPAPLDCAFELAAAAAPPCAGTSPADNSMVARCGSRHLSCVPRDADGGALSTGDFVVAQAAGFADSLPRLGACDARAELQHAGKVGHNYCRKWFARLCHTPTPVCHVVPRCGACRAERVNASAVQCKTQSLPQSKNHPSCIQS